MAEQIGIPLKGINKSTPQAEVYQAYSPKMSNVRVRDIKASRLRIGQRPGLAKATATQVGGVENPVVDMITVSTVE